MKIFLDTADVSLIRPAYETGLIDGVTTNPTLILKSGRQLKDVIQEISDSFPALESISAEVVGDTAGEMMLQAENYLTIPKVTIKVPCTVEGLKVCKMIKTHYDHKHTVNVTLVFSVAQAILSANAGADYVSPFVGRWMDNSVDGIEEYNALLEQQNHRCAICESTDPKGRKSGRGGAVEVFYVDHDHKTGKVRGLLCNICNRTMGYVGENSGVLEEMIKYLQKHQLT